MTLPCISGHWAGDQFVAGSPSFEPNDEYDQRMNAITEARNSLDDAEIALDRGLQAACDQHMADAMNCLVPA